MTLYRQSDYLRDTLFLVGFERVELTMALEKGKQGFTYYTATVTHHTAVSCAHLKEITFGEGGVTSSTRLLCQLSFINVTTTTQPTAIRSIRTKSQNAFFGMMGVGLCGLKSTRKDHDRRDIM